MAQEKKRFATLRKVAYYGSGADALKTIGKSGFAGVASGAGVVKAFGAMLKGQDATVEPLQSTSADERQRFQDAMAQYEVSDIALVQRGTARMAFTWAALTAAYFVFVISSYVWGAAGALPLFPAWLSTLLIEGGRWGLFAVMFTFTAKHCFQNWQVRERRLGSFYEFWRRGDWWPRSR